MLKITDFMKHAKQETNVLEICKQASKSTNDPPRTPRKEEPSGEQQMDEFNNISFEPEHVVNE